MLINSRDLASDVVEEVVLLGIHKVMPMEMRGIVRKAIELAQRDALEAAHDMLQKHAGNLSADKTTAVTALALNLCANKLWSMRPDA